MFGTTHRILCSLGPRYNRAVACVKDGRSAYWRLLMSANVQHLTLPEQYDDVTFPERRKLGMLKKQPDFHAPDRPRKMMQRTIDIRGPELLHTKLNFGKFGIMALEGGYLHHGHFEMIRLGINKRMDEKRMFAIWRVESPWKAISKRGQGKRMGGGKANIHHYVTPVKTGRLIIELGGKCELSEVQRFLKIVTHQLPFNAKIVTLQSMKEEEEKQKEIEEKNINPFSFDYIMNNNMLGCNKWIRRYDPVWKGKYR